MRTFPTFCTTFTAICALLAAGSPRGETAVLSASASGYVIDSVPTDGTFDSVSGPGASRVEVFQSAFGGLARGVLEYDVQGAGPFGSAAEIASVELTLFPAGTSGTSSQLDLYGYAADGILAVSDASVAGETLLSSFTVAGSGPVLTIDVTSFVAPSLVAGTETHVGFRVQLNDETVPPPVVLNVGDRNTAAANHPTLTITPVPAPSGAALLGLAAVCLFAGRHRRMRR